jgi:adenosine deaminase
MCKSPLHAFLTTLPKCEHHMHLEGALTPTLLFHLSAKNNIALPSPNAPASLTNPKPGLTDPDTPDPAFASAAALQARYDAGFADLDAFLHYYYIGMRVLRSADDFEALADAYFEQAANANVRHAEVFFDPQVHAANGVGGDVVSEGFGRAARKVRQRTGMTSLLVPCLLRHLSVEDGERWLAGALDKGWFKPSKDGGEAPFAGLGICSTELGRPPRMWAGIFAKARAAGLRVTAHAGEEGDASAVAEALDELKVTRIDHGINSAQSDEVMARLAKDNIMLTVCPLSNVQLKCVKRMQDVPLRKFLERGVKFSVNSDDPAYFGGFIGEVYCLVQEAFNFKVEDWEVITRAAIDGSWCSSERKGQLVQELEDSIVRWREVSQAGRA